MRLALPTDRFKAWKWQIPVLPRPQTEESIPLRVIVQAMVLVGIVATDLAGGTAFSLWTIPLSIVGAVFSWYRRRERNIALKFLLALAMLAALGYFFSNLLGTPNDTRLALAELLVHLQVIHSFDLPRRKDLGYSMVIGLVLLGVAGTLSQTLEFALALGGFTLLAIPALQLDYRSRLGLAPSSRRPDPRGLGQTLGWWLVALAVGAVIFVLLPRLSGFQWRAFPVSPDLSLPKDFDPERIRNPGYPMKSGDTDRGGGSTGASRNGSASQRFDPVQYAGFNDEIDLNLSGKLEPTLMLRVRAQAPSFWRVMAFDRYTGRGWKRTETKPTVLERSSRLQLYYLPRPGTRSQTREVVQTFSVLAELPNLIPAAAWPTQLYFPASRVALDRAGSLLSPSPLLPGTTYTVISAVPGRDIAALRRANRHYPPRLAAPYLQLPAGLDPGIARLAHSVTDRRPDPYLKALTLAQYLKQTYTLTDRVPPIGGRDDVARTLLFKARGGTPEHFATTLAVMLRTLGIPARLATGFQSGKYNPFTGYYEVYNTDATALVEVYFPEYGWLSFDPVPGRPLVPPALDKGDNFSLLNQTWQTITGWLPQGVRRSLESFFGAIVGAILSLFVWVASGLAGLGNLAALAVLAGLAGLVLVLWGIWQLWRSLGEHRRLGRLDPVEQMYQRALALAARRGYPRQSHQTPTEFLDRLAREIPAAAPPMTEITDGYLQWRYAEQTADLKALSIALTELRHRLGRRASFKCK